MNVLSASDSFLPFLLIKDLRSGRQKEWISLKMNERPSMVPGGVRVTVPSYFFNTMSMGQKNPCQTKVTVERGGRLQKFYCAMDKYRVTIRPDNPDVKLTSALISRVSKCPYLRNENLTHSKKLK
ncbi:hypothetical protein AVEN_89135-1 [Araneus ventricosus]|uniref:Uncharacterized protein n=1 Tax=Araneus ventricosus TaxID=182803 RepID=A0A4Y2B453_ARAVE|nr:hypothetical protein AVEN_89135-1 [Araneus ventricosus]